MAQQQLAIHLDSILERLIYRGVCPPPWAWDAEDRQYHAIFSQAWERAPAETAAAATSYWIWKRVRGNRATGERARLRFEQFRGALLGSLAEHGGAAPASRERQVGHT